MERLEYGAGRLAEALENSRRLGDGARHHLTHKLVGLIGRAGGAAIGDELIQIEHGFK